MRFQKNPDAASSPDHAHVDAQVEAQIARWHGIAPPNPPARRMVVQLEETIAGYARLRTVPALHPVPVDFARMLIALRDQDC